MADDKPQFIYIVCHRIKDAYAYAADRKMPSSAWLWADATIGYHIQLACAERPVVVLFHTDQHDAQLKRYLRKKRARIRYLTAPTMQQAAEIEHTVMEPVPRRRATKG